MESKIEFNISSVANRVGIPLKQVESSLKLLDDGNTIPFITRYRRDHTGGLDEEQIRAIRREAALQRGLVERKQTVLKAIESQGKLTEELTGQIISAESIKQIEDVYLPFKPKRQTLATTARQQGLEPLALDILECRMDEVELATRALDFVRVDRGVESVDQVMQGVKYLIAERYSENTELRKRLRDVFWASGKLCSVSAKPVVADPKSLETAKPGTGSKSNQAKRKNDSPTESSSPISTGSTTSDSAIPNPAMSDPPTSDPPKATAEQAPDDQKTADSEKLENTPSTLDAPKSEKVDQVVSEVAVAETKKDETKQTESKESAVEGLSTTATLSKQAELPANSPVLSRVTDDSETAVVAQESTEAKAEIKPPADKEVKSKSAKKEKQKPNKKSKGKKEESNPFQDYFDFGEPTRSIPPHRVLAINRGERAKMLKVKVDIDAKKCRQIATEILIPETAIYKDFLQECVSDALHRLIYPSLEREVRRELTEESERHAVTVFARNLRNLLLQPPVHHHKILAIDPGYRSGCKLAVVSETGKPIATSLIHVIGKDDRIAAGKEVLAKLINEHSVNVIAIGNGSACRQTEKLVAELIKEKFADQKVSYVVVNESGASVYSTSSIGREELPDYDPTFRSAISIGRRLLDPLAELVKINAANIGVGLYQHDIKAKHLHESLDEVVSSCVNFVGVDVNSASPSLLKYVAGMNQLTARKLYEHRQQNGPFKGREDFKKVSGFGDVTYTQSAGFLRISGGEELLDATSIHPESYVDAKKVMDRLQIDLSDLMQKPKVKSTPSSTVAVESVETTSADSLGETSEISLEQVADSATIANENADTTNQPTGSDVSSDANATSPVNVEKEVSPNQSDVSTSKVSENLQKILEKIKQVSRHELSAELGIGKLLLDDILETICRPGRDPREELPKPIFRSGVLKIEDLNAGMELDGRVINVVDFGAFVDIGIGNSALVHISVLSNKFIKSPHEAVSIGDTLRLWVTQVDKERRRVSLTAIKPGTEQPKPVRQRSQRFSKSDSNDDRRGKRKKVEGQANQRRDRKHRDRKPKKPKVPAKPITEAMAEGREAMRSFSDLQQFYKKKDDKGKK